MPPRIFVCVPQPSLSVYGVRVLQNHYCSQAKQAAAKILLSFARIERECGRAPRFRWSRKRSGSHRFVILLASMSPIKSLTKPISGRALFAIRCIGMVRCSDAVFANPSWLATQKRRSHALTPHKTFSKEQNEWQHNNRRKQISQSRSAQISQHY